MNTLYEQWLDRITTSAVAEPSPLESMGELELQSLWFQGVFGLEFVTTTGQEVVIHYLGEWNHGAGPDFLRCLLRIDGVEVQGAIELDMTPQDWETHQHAVNPDFDQVVLHVAFGQTSHEAFCRTSDSRLVPQVIISLDQLSACLQPTVSGQADTIPGYCAAEFGKWSYLEADQLLTLAAQYRLQRKAKPLKQRASTIGLAETLWQEVARTLGYGRNQLSMLHLSQRVKVQRLLSEPPDHRLALLLGSASFLTKETFDNAPLLTQTHLREMWEHWWRIRDAYEPSEARQIAWVYAGQRPPNHPHRRVAALSLTVDLIKQAQDCLVKPSAAAFDALEASFLKITHDFWSHHYTLSSQPAVRQVKLFGANTFQELLSNTLIPLWYIQDQEGAFAYYKTLKAKTPNAQVKRALGRLFPQHPEATTLSKEKYQHQGLQQLYQDFCLKSGCLQCPFPKISSYPYHTS